MEFAHKCVVCNEYFKKDMAIYGCKHAPDKHVVCDVCYQSMLSTLQQSCVCPICRAHEFGIRNNKLERWIQDVSIQIVCPHRGCNTKTRVCDMNVHCLRDCTLRPMKTVRVSNDHVYIGQIDETNVHDKKYHGEGKQTFEDGQVREGVWFNGIYRSGIISDPTGAIRDGEFNENTVLHGNGTEKVCSGVLRKGNFNNGKLDGYGEMHDPTTNQTRKGMWKNGCFRKGIEVNNDGVVMEGSFDRKGTFAGIGKITCRSEYELHGRFKKGELAAGTITYSNGDVLFGNFRNKQLTLMGRFTKGTGEELIGRYSQGKPHGRLMLIDPNKKFVVIGEWKNGILKKKNIGKCYYIQQIPLSAINADDDDVIFNEPGVNGMSINTESNTVPRPEAITDAIRNATTCDNTNVNADSNASISNDEVECVGMNFPDGHADMEIYDTTNSTKKTQGHSSKRKRN